MSLEENLPCVEFLSHQTHKQFLRQLPGSLVGLTCRFVHNAFEQRGGAKGWRRE